jgi:hypothetical protein
MYFVFVDNAAITMPLEAADVDVEYALFVSYSLKFPPEFVPNANGVQRIYCVNLRFLPQSQEQVHEEQQVEQDWPELPKAKVKWLPELSSRSSSPFTKTSESGASPKPLEQRSKKKNKKKGNNNQVNQAPNPCPNVVELKIGSPEKKSSDDPSSPNLAKDNFARSMIQGPPYNLENNSRAEVFEAKGASPVTPETKSSGEKTTSPRTPLAENASTSPVKGVSPKSPPSDAASPVKGRISKTSPKNRENQNKKKSPKKPPPRK